MVDLEKRLIELKKQVKNYQPNSIQKLIFTILFCSSVVLVGASIAYIMGNRYFVIDFPYVNFPLLESIVCCILFSINNWFVICFCFDLSIKKSLEITAFYIPIYILIEFLTIPMALKSVIIPSIYVICCYTILNPKKSIRFIFDFIIINIVMIVYQWMADKIKLNVVQIGFYEKEISIISKLVYSLDYYIFMLNIVLAKVVNRYERVVQNMELVVFPEDFNVPIVDNEDLAAIEQFKALQGLRKVKANLALVFFQIFQTIAILFLCRIGNVFVEGLIITFSYIIAGFYIKRRWHSESLIACTIISALAIFIAARTPPTARYSMLIFVVIGIATTYMFYRVTINGDGVPTPFNPDLCTETELIARCKLVGISDKSVPFCIRAFSPDFTAKAEMEINPKLTNEASVYRKKSRLKKKLING